MTPSPSFRYFKRDFVFCFICWSAAIINPNVPQARSLHFSPAFGAISFVITLINTFDVKYCPVADFFSLEFFQANLRKDFPNIFLLLNTNQNHQFKLLSFQGF